MSMRTFFTRPNSAVSSIDGSVLATQEPEEKGKYPLPIGKAGCLDGSLFALTGVQRSLYKEEIEDLIKKYGGRVSCVVSSKTTYLLLGKSGGHVMRQAAYKHGTKIIDEKGLFDMISNSSEDDKDDLPLISRRIQFKIKSKGDQAESDDTKHVFSDKKQIKQWVIEHHEMSDIYSEEQIIKESEKIKDRNKEKRTRIESEIAALKTILSQLPVYE